MAATDRPDSYKVHPIVQAEWDYVLWALKSARHHPKSHVFVQKLKGNQKAMKKKKRYYVSVYFDGKGHNETSKTKKLDRNGQSYKWSPSSWLSRNIEDGFWSSVKKAKKDDLDREGFVKALKERDIKLRFEVWRSRFLWRDAKEGSSPIYRVSDLIANENLAPNEYQDKNVALFSVGHQARIKKKKRDYKIDYSFYAEIPK